MTQRLLDAPAAPLKASEYWNLLDAIPDPSRLFGLDAAQIAQLSGVPLDLAERIAGRLDLVTAFTFELEQAEQTGLRFVTSVDEDYPTNSSSLKRAAPPLLYVGGDPKLLSQDLIGAVGSRDVTEEGAAVAREVASVAAGHGFGVVSGGAKGVDRLAMEAAIASDAVAVGVLADSLTRATRDAEMRRLISDGRVTLCTPYKPSAGFSVANAMGRNKLNYALSQATVVVASDLESGGTWAGG